MAKNKDTILTTGTGKNKRQWSLSPAEFARFEMIFEENELIDMTDLPTPILVQVAPPPFKK